MRELVSIIHTVFRKNRSRTRPSRRQGDQHSGYNQGGEFNNQEVASPSRQSSTSSPERTISENSRLLDAEIKRGATYTKRGRLVLKSTQQRNCLQGVHDLRWIFRQYGNRTLALASEMASNKPHFTTFLQIFKGSNKQIVYTTVVSLPAPDDTHALLLFVLQWCVPQQ